MPKQKNTFEVDFASLGDIKGVLSIQERLLLSKRTGERSLAQTGFLFYPITAGELKKLIGLDGGAVFVSRAGKRVVGYAAIYDLAAWKKSKPAWVNSITLTAKTGVGAKGKKTAYFRHIARLPGFWGAGKALEKSVFSWCRANGYTTVLGEIMHRPKANLVSRRVHIRRGFRKVGHAFYSDKTHWGIYSKSIGIKKRLKVN